ncbi:MAG: hypothetical protein WCI73_07380 [Phycisphaerae bacterium]
MRKLLLPVIMICMWVGLAQRCSKFMEHRRVEDAKNNSMYREHTNGDH